MANTSYIVPINDDNNNNDNNDDIICNICFDKVYTLGIDNGVHIKCNCKRGFICNDCIVSNIDKCPICRQHIINPLELENNLSNIGNIGYWRIIINYVSICLYIKACICTLLLLFLNVFILGYLLFIINFRKGIIYNMYEFRWIMGWGFILFFVLLIFIELLNGRCRGSNIR